MKPEHNKISTAATSSSTVVELRRVVSSLVVVFIVVSSVSLLIYRRQESQAVQLPLPVQQEVRVAAAGPQESQVELPVQQEVPVETEGSQESQVQLTDELMEEAAGEEETAGEEEATGEEETAGEGEAAGEEECNLSVGRWVYDSTSRPMYSGLNCSFSLEEGSCEKYGRNDTRYQHWRWQPNGCDLPRFNATKLLENLRNRRLVFVGDSLNRNQWLSLLCMVESSIPEGLKMHVSNGSLRSFKALEYNASIDFYWSPMILESNSDDPIVHRVKYRIIKADKIEKHARIWSNADIIVFNSYVWWRKQMQDMRMKVMYGSFEEGDAELDEVEMVKGFEIALEKLTDWLGTHIDNKTKIYFAGSSPTHSWASDWGGDNSNKCVNETEPVLEAGYKGGSTDYSMMEKAEQIFKPLVEKKGIHVQILNFTQLSDSRIDAHPTVFKRQYGAPLTAEQIANPSSYADCTHWCLPGVPDVWNHFLYSYLVQK